MTVAAPRVPASRAWTRPLRELLPALTRELGERRDHWVYRTLERGALVALQRRSSDGRRIIRIARRDRPQDPEAWKRWGKELEVFQKHLGIQHWKSIGAQSSSGVAVIYLDVIDSR